MQTFEVIRAATVAARALLDEDELLGFEVDVSARQLRLALVDAGFALELGPYARPVDAFRHVFDDLQSFLADSTTFAWGQARPPCPGHRHPRRLRIEHGVAFLICPEQPATGEQIFP